MGRVIHRCFDRFRPLGHWWSASKSRAARSGRLAAAEVARSEPACHSAERWRASLAQGKPRPAWGRTGALLAALLWVHAAWACQPVPLQPLAPGLWLVPAAQAESDAGNRGHASHLVVARAGSRLWLVGAGPTPAFGERLRCTLQRRLGGQPHQVLVPWARAELALGARSLAPATLVAHATVADAMAEQCAHCVDRLRQRLGEAAADLGDDPVRLPGLRLEGTRGRWGPFDWWVLPRAAARTVTLLQHRASGLWLAHGLLWGDGPPDTRDADLEPMQQAMQALLPRATPRSRWVGEAGGLLDAEGLRAQVAYLVRLREAAAEAVRQGDLATEPPPGSGPDHPRHALNWQRAVRQAEEAYFQRSLR